MDSLDRRQGLSSEQVAQRVRDGLSNADEGIKTKTEKQIILENTFTFFNILNFVLALFVLLVGSFKNLLFLGVIFSNIIIGSFQGIRAKRTIDKLSLISAPKASVLRDGKLQTIPVSGIVMNDMLHLSTGQQICADAIVLDGEAEGNESLITGESDPVLKRAGDELLSGSFIVSGSCYAEVEHVGRENYANRIANGAKYVKRTNSEILHSLDFIVKTLGFTLVPIGILLFCKQFFLLHDTIREAVVSTVAAILGMIPEGLILLTSVVFAVSVLRLSRYKTLVQDLYCTESLARVDVLCLDKTGTITEGTMQVDEMHPLTGYTEEDMTAPLKALVQVLTDDNPTYNAVKAYFPGGSDWKAAATVPFSSARKWSGAYFGERGTYVLMSTGVFVAPLFPTLLTVAMIYFGKDVETCTCVILFTYMVFSQTIQLIVGLVCRYCGVQWGYRIVVILMTIVFCVLFFVKSHLKKKTEQERETLLDKEVVLFVCLETCECCVLLERGGAYSPPSVSSPLPSIRSLCVVASFHRDMQSVDRVGWERPL